MQGYRTSAALLLLAVGGFALLLVPFHPGRPARGAPGAGGRQPSKETGAKAPAGPYAGGREPDRSKLPDSFKYYGPNGLWWKWGEAQKLGRDTWFFYTGGNQKFYRLLARFGGELGISVDFFRLLDTRRRRERFKELGLINEPNFGPGGKDAYGFWVDKWNGDPVPGAYPENPKWYGEPTGIIGLRKFPNPAFTEAMKKAWLKDPDAGVRRYFANPGKVEPPYVVGISCAFCHVAFDPLNPPADTASPRWENLAANIGNQYFREGDLFLGAGRVVGGDANPGPTYADRPGKPGDPYDTRGLDEKSFFYHYGHTQQPGTSETSRFSYDFINNPNTINQIINVGNRAGFCEATPTGLKLITNHILKDGSDSVGIHAALLRVYVNIGSEGDYWADHLWNPATGTTQAPFSIPEVRLQVPAGRKKELLQKYPELGQAWKESERRVPFLVSYLASYTPYALADLKDEKGLPKYLSKDKGQLRRGAEVFADHCARCHSNKQPFYPLSGDGRKRFYRDLVLSDTFLPGNTLSDDVRYPFNHPGLGVNAARALATNAIDGDIWAEFSSRDYKALPPLRYLKFENPLDRLDPRLGPGPIVTEFVAPGGGRGYYRTAALNSMWATAPFLHNNSVGRDPVDRAGKLDPRYVSVEGRLELFEDAMDQLLNPQKRPLKVKVTSADSGLTAGLPALRRRLGSMLRDLARQVIEEALAKVVAEALDKSDLDADLKKVVRVVLQDLSRRLQPELDKLFSEQNLKNIEAAVAGQVKQQLEKVIADRLKDKPAVAQFLAPLKGKFEEALKARGPDLVSLFQPDLVIPRGTPVNLIMNLHIGKLPYALKVYLANKNDPRKLAEGLLKLSDCPDLIDNRGHTYGSDLSPEDKRALIEYLKTL